MTIKSWLESREIKLDARAVAAALTLCAFLWVTKIWLAAWFWFDRGIDTFADNPHGSFIYVGGEDLFVCAVLAVIYFGIFRLAALFRRPLREIIAAVPMIIHVAIVI